MSEQATNQDEFAVSPNTARQLVERCISVDRPVMVWGPPGTGKSDIVAQIAAAQDRPVIDMRLLIMEPTDLKGIPFYCPDSNTMRWARPGELPGEDEVELHNAILFLDEITAAPPSVQAAAYQLILNRRVGTYELPSGVSIVAAGNRETDRAVAHRMPSALKNRFVHLTVRPGFDDWFEWAINNDIHPDIVGFLKANPGKLFTFDPKSSDNAFATPRTWAFVSSIYDSELPESTNRQLIGGTVGHGLAVEFMAHVRLKGQLPDPADVLSGSATELDRSSVNPSAMYSLAIALCYYMKQHVDNLTSAGQDPATDTQWQNMSDRFLEFIMDNMHTEMVIMAGIMAFRSYQLPLNTESDTFGRFFEGYKGYLKIGS